VKVAGDRRDESGAILNDNRSETERLIRPAVQVLNMASMVMRAFSKPTVRTDVPVLDNPVEKPEIETIGNLVVIKRKEMA
jgi:hypothetical protein